jgi:hydroxymethylglutaryl-CoA lyase
MLRYVECPRDSWQGLQRFILTEEKVSYLQDLLDAGFKHLDMGSFVSSKAVPQLADTEDVLTRLSVPSSDTDLLCIIANERGLERALVAKNVTSVGYPLSVNDTFQRRNTNRSLEASWSLIRDLLNAKGRLELIVHVSMGFGNPYNEPWQASDTAKAVTRLREMGIRQIALADTVGTATPQRLKDVLSTVEQPETLGLHLHARPHAWQEQLDVALGYGIMWFEGALAGVGGCPFAGDELVGNLPTEQVLPWLESKGLNVPVSTENLQRLSLEAARLAMTYK